MSIHLLTTLLALATLPSSAEPSAFGFEGPRFIDKNTCRIFSQGVGRERCFAPEGDPGGGGAGGSDDKKFTQQDLNRIAAEERRKSERELAEMKTKLTALEAMAAEHAEYKKQLAEVTEREKTAREEAELKGKTEAEKAQIAIQKLTEQVRQKDEQLKARDVEWQQKYGQLDGSFADHIKTEFAAKALLGAKVHRDAAADASVLFMRAAQIELDEKRLIKSVSIDGTPYADLKAAAEEWLKSKPYYVEAQPGGTGGPQHGGRGGPLNPKDMANRTTDELFNDGLKTPVAPVPGGLSLAG